MHRRIGLLAMVGLLALVGSSPLGAQSAPPKSSTNGIVAPDMFPIAVAQLKNAVTPAEMKKMATPLNGQPRFERYNKALRISGHADLTVPPPPAQFHLVPGGPLSGGAAISSLGPGHLFVSEWPTMFTFNSGPDLSIQLSFPAEPRRYYVVDCTMNGVGSVAASIPGHVSDGPTGTSAIDSNHVVLAIRATDSKQTLDLKLTVSMTTALTSCDIVRVDP